MRSAEAPTLGSSTFVLRRAMSSRGRHAGFTPKRAPTPSCPISRRRSRAGPRRARSASMIGARRDTKGLRRFVSEAPGQISASGLEQNFHFKEIASKVAPIAHSGPGAVVGMGDRSVDCKSRPRGQPALSTGRPRLTNRLRPLAGDSLSPFRSSKAWTSQPVSRV
jgi:hypothetical protein